MLVGEESMHRGGEPVTQSWTSRLWRLGTRLLLVAFVFSIATTLPLRWLNPPTSAFIIFDSADVLAKRIWFPLQDVAGAVPLAIVAAEDQKFPVHHGFDLEAISDAMSEERGRTRGASTITQQLAKNLYLWSGRSVVRKGIEAWMTVLLELFLPKQRILELYVNVVEFGPGIYGIGAASREHFGKQPMQLTRREAALLAAVLPNPKSRSAARPSAYVNRRASDIQRMMGQLGDGYID